jgi:amyloid beta precursor protein binding protein 1
MGHDSITSIWSALGKDFVADSAANEFVAMFEKKLDQAIEEINRAAGAELHNISSLTGGMVAQEAIKVITRQYVPVDNVCVFDGVVSQSAVWRL